MKLVAENLISIPSTARRCPDSPTDCERFARSGVVGFVVEHRDVCGNPFPRYPAAASSPLPRADVIDSRAARIAGKGAGGDVIVAGTFAQAGMSTIVCLFTARLNAWRTRASKNDLFPIIELRVAVEGIE